MNKQLFLVYYTVCILIKHISAKIAFKTFIRGSVIISFLILVRLVYRLEVRTKRIVIITDY